MVFMYTDIGGDVHFAKVTSQDDYALCAAGVLAKLCAPGTLHVCGHAGCRVSLKWGLPFPGSRMRSGPVAVVKSQERTPSGLGASNSCKLLWHREEVRRALDTNAKFSEPPTRGDTGAVSRGSGSGTSVDARGRARKAKSSFVVLQPFVQGLSGHARCVRACVSECICMRVCACVSVAQLVQRHCQLLTSVDVASGVAQCVANVLGPDSSERPWCYHRRTWHTHRHSVPPLQRQPLSRCTRARCLGSPA